VRLDQTQIGWADASERAPGSGVRVGSGCIDMARLLWRYNALAITPAGNGKPKRRAGEGLRQLKIGLKLGERTDR
jgi:hypothetical protein